MAYARLFRNAVISTLLIGSISTITYADPLQDVISKYSPEFLADAIVRNTVTVSSKEGTDGIPEAELYHSALLRIILNASVTEKEFDPSDWELIVNLPAHNDGQFAVPHYHLLRANCQHIQSIPRDGTSRSAEAVATTFGAGEKNIQQSLLSHYESFLATLSERGRERVEREVAEFAQVANVVHTTMDLVGLSQDAPEYVEVVIGQACRALEQAPPPEPETHFLRDVPAQWDLVTINEIDSE